MAQMDSALNAPMAPMTTMGEVRLLTSHAPTEMAVPSASESAKEQLNKLVSVDVDRAAQVLKKWLNDPERRAA